MTEQTKQFNNLNTADVVEPQYYRATTLQRQSLNTSVNNFIQVRNDQTCCAFKSCLKAWNSVTIVRIERHHLPFIKPLPFSHQSFPTLPQVPYQVPIELPKPICISLSPSLVKNTSSDGFVQSTHIDILEDPMPTRRDIAYVFATLTSSSNIIASHLADSLK
ncbi:uncharacterized protein LALA0_S15e00298g [Lachancea lanzarotensis]|uniref:LALA0S15e00298g1_1 n=1 Tax=Lachancea lanzarotensis TaxID=1245769 RepID=A0A0C7NGQ7_9SACH|nr:uncharacterized protein LALA0_S15e00298g [Lachancea lanzarotensis]CEP64916.1 LALA0S15e00298g1_1 [Lachancea lanzarotensis]